MVIEIFYSVNDVEASIVVAGDTIEDAVKGFVTFAAENGYEVKVLSAEVLEYLSRV